MLQSKETLDKDKEVNERIPDFKKIKSCSNFACFYFFFFFYFLILLNKAMISINSKKIENPQKIVEREKSITLN